MKICLRAKIFKVGIAHLSKWALMLFAFARGHRRSTSCFYFLIRFAPIFNAKDTNKRYQKRFQLKILVIYLEIMRCLVSLLK